MIPSCCVTEAFDSFIQTCCGSSIYDNPVLMESVSMRKINK